MMNTKRIAAAFKTPQIESLHHRRPAEQPTVDSTVSYRSRAQADITTSNPAKQSLLFWTQTHAVTPSKNRHPHPIIVLLIVASNSIPHDPIAPHAPQAHLSQQTIAANAIHAILTVLAIVAVYASDAAVALVAVA